jgi:hypothetical protein
MKTRLNGVALVLLLAGSMAMAGEQGTAAEAARSEPARKLEIPDEPLVDQDGKPRRFYSDLIRGPEKHLTSVIIGDSVTGTWLRALAMAPPENLAYAVENLNDETH